MPPPLPIAPRVPAIQVLNPLRWIGCSSTRPRPGRRSQAVRGSRPNAACPRLRPLLKDGVVNRADVYPRRLTPTRRWCGRQRPPGPLYREAQLALRAVIGGRELEQFLADKDAVAKELEGIVRQRVAALALEVISVGSLVAFLTKCLGVTQHSPTRSLERTGRNSRRTYSSTV